MTIVTTYNADGTIRFKEFFTEKRYKKEVPKQINGTTVWYEV